MTKIATRTLAKSPIQISTMCVCIYIYIYIYLLRQTSTILFYKDKYYHILINMILKKWLRIKDFLMHHGGTRQELRNRATRHK